ncbi:MAG: TAT-variant-translocated molybdopterin oxidoreductase [Ignavibacteriaceae bacterium]|nr:TAT-variant-translocated molybdopterin oxidoreductase [Ignavibacteriaceae bacterium]
MSELKNQEENNLQNTNYWKSFEELYRDQKTITASHHEFQEGVTDDFDPDKNLTGISRRRFLALLGASAAFAGAGCSEYPDKGAIIPYNKKPEEVVLGKANYYASTCTGCSSACGILIKTREGRPIKVDGNPDHPVSQGKICSQGQASILNLYDPSRLKDPMVYKDGFWNKEPWGKIDQDILAILKSAQGKEISIITRNVTSPTFKKLLSEFSGKFGNTKVYSYEIFNNLSKESAWQKCYPGTSIPAINWEGAKVIVSFEGDFLGVEGNKIEQSRMFAANRDVNNPSGFNRLYVAESNMSLTGTNADHRIRIPLAGQSELLLAVVNELALDQTVGSKLNATLKNLASGYSLSNIAQKYKLNISVLKAMITDLVKNQGKSVVFGGRLLTESEHIVINGINDALGNNSLFIEPHVQQINPATLQELKELTDRMKQGSIHAAIVVDCNPVYEFPSDLKVMDALKKVDYVISLSEFSNETTSVSKIVLPISHTFESWGDHQTRHGHYSLQQPVIAPLYGTRQKEAIILNFLNEKPSAYTGEDYHKYLMENWRTNVYPLSNSIFGFEKYWLGVLHDGVLTLRIKSNASYSLSDSAFTGIQLRKESSGYALVLAESPHIKDGRFAHNGWLQELPHPVTKVTWDNYAAVSYDTAVKLGVKTNDLVKISGGGDSLEVPVLVQPGLADNHVIIELGYGRTNSHIVADGAGFNANIFLKSSGSTPFTLSEISVSKAGGKYSIVSTQDHHTYDEDLIKDIHEKRGIIREGTLSQFVADPDFLHHGKTHAHVNMYEDHEYDHVKWGMAIDLNKCIGCGDCTVACNVENNIPVVGKDQVERGRDMLWLRIDRYYSGPPEEPKVSFQPMLCQHCDQAPCENVCPVVATTHSPDGLNQMVYNRCVGTRYCSNNCPYKVRRFNYYNFRDHFAEGHYLADSLELLHNPEVTVRSRGVMEKCTFCIQRISDARAEAIEKGVALTGEEVKTACQEACVTNAIKFGSVNNTNSELYKYRNHKLGYHVLEELNTRPNVTYVAKLKNTFSEEA